MRVTSLALLLCCAATVSSHAGAVRDRVHSEAMVHCGAIIRPGLAFPAQDGTWHGLEVEICRAVAVAALGPAARFEFHGYAPMTRSFDRVRSGSDDLSFLSASEILAENALPALLPGPAVFYATSGMLVMQDSPATNAAGLAGQRICAEPGTGPERSLAAWFKARHLDLHVFAFQESDEMLDAFYGGRCDAIANETVNLAAIGLQAGQDGHKTRLLPEPLDAAPILATSPRQDGDWATIVAWTVATLLHGDAAEDGLPLDGAALGLAPDWQGRVLAAVGEYGAIYDRSLGEGSPLGLPRGLNAAWTQGGLMCPPASQ